MYTDGSGHPRIRYGTEVDSTKSQLGTATKLGISQVGYWTFNTLDDAMGKAPVAWTRACPSRSWTGCSRRSASGP